MADSKPKLADSPELCRKFEMLKAIFTRFAESEDEDTDFLLYLKFKALAKIIKREAEVVTGHPTHFAEESERVMGWMRYKIGFDESGGYCSNETSARQTLEGALKWG